MPDGTQTHPWLRGPVPYPLGHWGFVFLESEAKFALSTYVTKFYSTDIIKENKPCHCNKRVEGLVQAPLNFF